MGDNGQPASRFPDTPVPEEHQGWAAEVQVADHGLFRVTLTAPFINQAAMAASPGAGQQKAAVLREVLHGLLNPRRLSAQLIEPQPGELRWLIDLEAAALLPS